ncbi:MAG: DUF4445 domain-containing protein [Chloroflexi bacterium]|nr:MAG: DUF4445 domain-containing protein [Chloroflexota bacterium]MBL1193816.1 DUF4445 domain-containing protein [Chloroflexota bacterium]NOH11109.1 DUF4445 domain-containing protein [Chloroflexota bacterium]
MPSGRRGDIEEGTTILEAARHLSVEIESICGGRQTCNKCLVKIEEGQFDKHAINSSSSHVTTVTEKEQKVLIENQRPDLRMSCAAEVFGDILVTIPEESRAQKQIIRKSARELSIDIAPAIRLTYVEIEEAELGEHRGDWGRLQDALEAQWGLKNLSIDLLALRNLQARIREGKWKVTATIWNDQEVIDVKPGFQEGIYGLAVDIGSTTVASFLTDLRTGANLATEVVMNPQVSYGEDLMSRISYAMTHPDGLEKMHKAIIDTLNKLASKASREAGIDKRDITEIVLVGNTTMTHVVLGISPIELGGTPFALANRDAMDFKARELGLRLHPGANCHILPSQAGHVGADNVSVLIAEQPYKQDKTILTIDVGTNAEIVLSSKDWMYSASSPTGPAFEGGQISSGMRAAPGAIERVRIDPQTKEPRFRVIGEERWSEEWQTGPDTEAELRPKHLAAGICGSGIIEVIAELYLAEVLTADGRFNHQVVGSRLQWSEDKKRGAYVLATADQSSSGKPIVVTQDDVRNIQLAKAALYAGAKLLIMRAGVNKVDQIILAGAFGSYIDPKHAMVLGLILDCELDDVIAVGNAAGDGARLALLNREKRAEAQRIATNVRYIETAVDKDFQDEFVNAMSLPHSRDDFPHLADILPQTTDPIPPQRIRRFQRTGNK